MKKVGIICEYNPLHNGHVYHYNQVRSLSNADLIILSLSSSFCQRGDLSIIDKFTKTQLALTMGVDIVIENPTIFSIQEASKFAYFHVLNLVRADVDEIWIGSEQANDKLYERYLNLIESDTFKNKQKEYLLKGYSLKLSFTKTLFDFGIKNLKSNDMLGVFYYKALKELNPSIKLKTIKRENSNYNETEFNKTIFQSATAIRNNIFKAKSYVPSYTYDKLKDCLDEDKLFPFIKYNVLINNHLFNLLETSEGIENRLKLISNAKNFKEALEFLSTKRYSISKIKRLLINVLIDLTKDEFHECELNYNYIRILGFNTKGQKFLKTLKEKTKIVTNIKEGMNISLDIELKISKILDLIYHKDLLKKEQKGPIIK